MSNILQIYSPRRSPRLDYALELVFSNILGISYSYSDKPDNTLPLINYSDDRSIGGVFIQPEGLLFETGIERQDIWVAHFEGLPLFFQQPPEAGFYIDIFSFVFYMTSRYEEYLPQRTDEHGRFAAESSLAYKHNFLDLPVVDLWVLRLGNTLEILYPGLRMRRNEFTSLLTVDVDIPFAYRDKGLFRNSAGMVRDLLSGTGIGERLRCLLGRARDPYDTYSYLNGIAADNNVPVKYFFTTGNRSRFDKNPLPGKRCYRRLIRKLAARYETGLHPSYRSHTDVRILRREIRRLEKVTRKPVDSVRKHFLLLSFPQTYHVLEEEKLLRDYTLGFVREAGFRAGIARPFRFYDIANERATPIILYPFQYMDGTLQQYKRYSPDEAKQVIESLVEQTRRVGGLFVSLWHNTSLTEREGWEGWRDVFESAMKMQCNNGVPPER